MKPEVKRATVIGISPNNVNCITIQRIGGEALYCLYRKFKGVLIRLRRND